MDSLVETAFCLMEWPSIFLTFFALEELVRLCSVRMWPYHEIVRGLY